MSVSYDSYALLSQLDWRVTPATTAAYLSGGAWEPAKHLLKMSAIIATELRKGNARIIVTMPPRHGKSEHTSVWTPVWALDRWPDKNIILSTYGAELSTDFSIRVRDILRQHSDELNVQLRQDRQNVARFMTDQGGGLFAVGIGGAITGRGANIFIIDDYIKNFEQAQSPTALQNIYDWYKTTARTRLEPGASIIIVATRWDANDLVGRILADNPQRWTVINFSATAIEGEEDLLGREPHQALWPARFDEKMLEELMTDLGLYFYECMFQQRPPKRNVHTQALTKMNYVEVLPANRYLRRLRQWDLAATSTGDSMVGALVSVDKRNDDTYIEHIVREKVDADGVENLIKSTAAIDGVNIPISLEIEPGSQGLVLFNHYVRNVLKGYVVKFVRSNKSKFTRWQPLFARIAAGTVFMKVGRWNHPFLDELRSAPSDDADDQIDAVAHAFNDLHGFATQSPIWGRGLRNKSAETGGKSDPQVIGGRSRVAWGRNPARSSKSKE